MTVENIKFPLLAYDIKALIKASGLKRSHIYKEMIAGRLKYRKAGRRTLFLPDDAEAWMRAMPVGEPSHSANCPSAIVS